MKLESTTTTHRRTLDEYASKGRYHFTKNELQNSLKLSDAAVKSTLSRLAQQGLIASPAKGFYVIVPPEYRVLGCLPAEQFIPALMEHLQLPYYVGLLSAAQYHGAAHQRPQEFQVFLEKNRPGIRCGSVRVAFIANKRLQESATKTVNTPRGTLRISTPETTALDLVAYPDRVGGLDQVATVLSELSESIDANELVSAAQTRPIGQVQRLGYLLELGDGIEKSSGLKSIIDGRARNFAKLESSGDDISISRSERWKLMINTEVDLDT